MQSVNDHGRVLFGQENDNRAEYEANAGPSFPHGPPQSPPKRPATPDGRPEDVLHTTATAGLELAMVAGLTQPEFENNIRHTMATEGLLSAGAGKVAASEHGGRGLADASMATDALRQGDAVLHAALPPGTPQDACWQEKMMAEWLQRQEAEMEPWEVVRDVLLTWPCSPTKEHIDSCRHLIQQQVFVERWLRTSNRGGTGKVEETVRRLLKHVAWRYEYKVDGILDEDWSAHDVRNEMYVSGLDRHRRPSVTWRVSQHDPNLPRGQTPALGARYLVCTIERARAVNPLSRHIIFICDCSGLQWKNFEHAMFVEAVGMLQENYPDNLAHCFLFPVGWLINSLLSVCRPLLDKDTASKMSVLTEENLQKGMREHFSNDEIEVRLGGKLDVTKSRHRRVSASEAHSLATSWEDRDGCGVARVWLYRDMMELQRKFVPAEHHHLLVDTPNKLATKHAREMVDRMSLASSSPSVRGDVSRGVSEDWSEAGNAIERLRLAANFPTADAVQSLHVQNGAMSDVHGAETPQLPPTSPGSNGATVTETVAVMRAEPRKALRTSRPNGSSMDIAAPAGHDKGSSDTPGAAGQETDSGPAAAAAKRAVVSKVGGSLVGADKMPGARHDCEWLLLFSLSRCVVVSCLHVRVCRCRWCDVFVCSCVVLHAGAPGVTGDSRVVAAAPTHGGGDGKGGVVQWQGVWRWLGEERERQRERERERQIDRVCVGERERERERARARVWRREERMQRRCLLYMACRC